MKKGKELAETISDIKVTTNSVYNKHLREYLIFIRENKLHSIAVDLFRELANILEKEADSEQ